MNCRYCGKPSEDKSGVCHACESRYKALDPVQRRELRKIKRQPFLKIGQDFLNNSMNKTKPPTTKELAALAGRLGFWRVSGIRVRVRVNDARYIYGRLEYHITPLMGFGEAWVQSVELDKIAARFKDLSAENKRKALKDAGLEGK